LRRRTPFEARNFLRPVGSRPVPRLGDLHQHG
jgi:hypothetical protein